MSVYNMTNKLGMSHDELLSPLTHLCSTNVKKIGQDTKFSVYEQNYWNTSLTCIDVLLLWMNTYFSLD